MKAVRTFERPYAFTTKKRLATVALGSPHDLATSRNIVRGHPRAYLSARMLVARKGLGRASPELSEKQSL
eukprot:682818-Karenia_brevis.AAC.1